MCLCDTQIVYRRQSGIDAETTWGALLAEKPDVLEEVRTKGVEMGFSDIYIYDVEKQLLASISQDSIYLPHQTP